jgi:putative addiction module antidote
MGISAKLTRIGASLGIVLPEDAIAALGAAEGDTVTFTPEPGGFHLTAAEPELARQLALGRAVLAQYDEALAELAK